jgi:hypothetical protein
MNRKQRRTSEKQIRTENNLAIKNNPIVNNKTEDDPTKQQIINLAKDLKTVFDYTKSLEFKLNLITETLIRVGVASTEDIKETQFLYSKKDETKILKIKQLLSQDLDIEDILRIVEDSPETPGYLRLGIDPVRDLNVNPYELAQFLKDSFSDTSLEEVIKYSKKYGLNESHFGFSKPTGVQP